MKITGIVVYRSVISTCIGKIVYCKALVSVIKRCGNIPFRLSYYRKVNGKFQPAVVLQCPFLVVLFVKLRIKIRRQVLLVLQVDYTKRRKPVCQFPLETFFYFVLFLSVCKKGIRMPMKIKAGFFSWNNDI